MVPLFDEAAVLQLRVDQQQQMSASSLYTHYTAINTTSLIHVRAQQHN